MKTQLRRCFSNTDLFSTGVLVVKAYDRKTIWLAGYFASHIAGRPSEGTLFMSRFANSSKQVPQKVGSHRKTLMQIGRSQVWCAFK